MNLLDYVIVFGFSLLLVFIIGWGVDAFFVVGFQITIGILMEKLFSRTNKGD